MSKIFLKEIPWKVHNCLTSNKSEMVLYYLVCINGIVRVGCKYIAERNLGNDKHDHSTTTIYMDKILPNFDPIPSRVDNCGHFT